MSTYPKKVVNKLMSEKFHEIQFLLIFNDLVQQKLTKAKIAFIIMKRYRNVCLRAEVVM